MPVKLYPVIAIVTAVIFSCAQKKETVVIDESLLPPASATQAQPAAFKDSILPVAAGVQQGNTVLPTAINSNAAPVNANVQTIIKQPPVATGQNLNPAHGQPGHRCDISVGAPLNSKPTQPAQPAAQTGTVTTAPAKVNAPAMVQKTLPGMNPQHGEPNHRCDIAVGAPLNSKPAPAAVPVNVTPVQADSTKNNN